MRLRVAIAAALSSGVLLWASAPPVGYGWLAWAAIVPAAAVALRAPGTRAGRLAVPLAYGVYLELLIVPALPFGIAHGQWGDPVLPIMVGDSPAVFAALVGIPLFALALYAIGFPHAWPPAGAAAALLVPALSWTALDVLRAKLDPSGLWGPLFLSQHGTPAAHLSLLAGPWLLTFAVVLVNYAVALVLVRGRPALRAAAATAAVLALAAPAAAVAARAAPVGPEVAVAAVQPGYDTAELEHPPLRHFRPGQRDDELASLDLIDDLAPLTRRAARAGAEVVVWPEATVWVAPEATATTRAALADLARETGAALVVPYFLRDRAAGAAVVVTPDGAFAPPQPKQRPMWFLGERGRDDPPPVPAPTRAGALGMLLGVDNQDPGAARALAARGAALLGSSTHDWAELAPQQRAYSRLHAAGLRVPLVRADWRYGSAVVNAGGRLAADAGRARSRIAVIARVSSSAGATPYARAGDAFAWAAVAAAIGAPAARVLVPLVRRRASGG